MREFVVVGHEAPTTAEFSLDDLPGAGRLDVLCRCVTAAFGLSHDFRDEVRVRLVLGDEYVVRFEGAELRHLRPDERSAGSLIRGALEARDGAIGAMEATASPGVHVGTGDFESAVAAAAEMGTLVELHADGDPIVDLEPLDDVAFVLSDHRNFTDAEAAVLERAADECRSLGPEPIHADDAVTVAHNYLDTDGFEAY
ncbi:tRNA (pseudouridine(54)-N(1))-methyltransferase TrmY [Halobacteriales archaeon QS_4_69_225]|nr:MAG: tRNA (pseudouridine(54)-N(1))-methyltransferase TrmY [Halobacteriales archaeon QS_4_69_225]